jgi:hypothetical protein
LMLLVGEWSASRSGSITPDAHWIGRVDPRAGLDKVQKRNSLTLQGLELRYLRRPTRSQSDYAIP